MGFVKEKLKKKLGSLNPKEIVMNLDGFAKELPKDLPKLKFRSWQGVLLSLLLYVILGGFVMFSIEMIEEEVSGDSGETDDSEVADGAIVE